MKLRVYQSSKNHQWYVRLTSSNNKKILWSEGYKAKRNAVKIAHTIAQSKMNVCID